jgi:asparagine synthetase B (glutamine-hydrolysing)
MGITEPLETYSIGLEGAEDLKYADIMANFLGSKHTSLVGEEKDFLANLLLR